MSLISEISEFFDNKIPVDLLTLRKGDQEPYDLNLSRDGKPWDLTGAQVTVIPEFWMGGYAEGANPTGLVLDTGSANPTSQLSIVSRDASLGQFRVQIPGGLETRTIQPNQRTDLPMVYNYTQVVTADDTPIIRTAHILAIVYFAAPPIILPRT